MIRTHDDADVGRSVERYRALGAAYARLADRLRAERDALARRIAPLLTVQSMGGAHSRAIATGGPITRIMRRCRTRMAYLNAKLSVVNREIRFWLSAVDQIIALHQAEADRGIGWTVPVVHDPVKELRA